MEMALFQLVAVLFAVILGAREGHGRSMGAPTGACGTITPSHGGSSGTLPGGFYLYSDLIDNGGTYTSGTSYTSTSNKINNVFDDCRFSSCS